MKTWWIVPLLVAAALPYASSWNAQPFDDDYSMIRDGDVVRQDGLFRAFTEPQTWGWFRPMRAVMSSMSTAPGRLPIGPHVVDMACHTLAVLLVFLLGRRLFPGSFVPWCAAGLMAFSQSNAMAVLMVDGFNEIGVSIAWYAGTLAVLAAVRGARPAWALSTLCLLAGLLTKESMTAFPLVTAAAALAWRGRNRTWFLAALHVAVAGVFLLYRQGVVGAEFAGSPDATAYRFGIGANVVRNAAMLLFSLATPLSSLRIATEAGPLQRAFAGGAAVVFLAAVTAGVVSAVRSGRAESRAVLFSSVWLAVSTLPNVLLAHVSELYAYRMGGAFFLLAAVSFCGPLYARRRKALAVAGVVWLGFNLFAIHEKSVGIREAGDRAELILQTVQRTLPDPEQGARIHVYDEWGGFDGREYGVFSVHGVRVFRTMLDYALNRRYGRDDITASVNEGPDALRIRSAPGFYVFRYLVAEDRVEYVPPRVDGDE